MPDLEELAQRVACIEARQRAAGVHDAYCPQVYLARAEGLPMPFASDDCCCWLVA